IFDGADQRTLLHQILHTEPRPPRALNPAIPAELETVILKAVAKAPAERYAMARDLADDLQRFLRHEPVLARRPTLARRARKWLRRHPSVLAAGAVLLVLVAAGSFAGAWVIQGEKEKTQRRAEEAEARFQLARRAADDLIELAEEELADKPHLEGARRRLLMAALAYYGELIEQRRDDPGARKDLDATRARVEKILADLAVLQGAGQLFLLDASAVLDDLRLSAEQRQRVGDFSKRLAEQRHQSFHAFHRMSPAERQRRFVELARANEAAVSAILTPGQLRRLEQIALQLRGPLAFREPTVAAAL